MKNNETEPRWESIGGSILVMLWCFLLLAVGHGGFQ